MRQPRHFIITGRHVFALVIGFFVAIIAVNATFIIVATQTFPGLASEKPFQHGLAPRLVAVRAARALQAERGWHARLEALRDPATGETIFTLAMRGGEEQALGGLAIEGMLERRVTASEDRLMRFVERESGLYEARLEGVGQGEWRLVLRTSFPDGVPFEEERTLWLP